MLQQCIIKCPNGALGLNLSRAPWDPYPWVSGVQAESNARLAGVCVGDTLLQLNGIDVLGMRISELANRLREHWLTGAEHATMMMWRQQTSPLTSTDDPNEAAHAVQHGINQQSLEKFATCLQHIAQLLECPVCCDVIKPPGWQCCNGHVLCNNCRNRSVKCPVCRVPLGPRGRCLLSDKLFTLLAENFPCDGVKIKKDVEQNNNNSRSNVNTIAKCTTEYHNQPKMALAKSNAGKKTRKTSRQMQEDTVILVVNGQSDGEETKMKLEQCVKQVPGVPKGNEQSAQIQNNVNDAGLQRGVIGNSSKERREEQKEEEQEVTKELLRESNNMLVKPKLKLSKKSWQITGRDQDELHCDEVANINNGQHSWPRLGVAAGQVPQQQQYQNYHCPTGKSGCCFSQAKLCQQPTASDNSDNNKLSTVKRRESGNANANTTANFTATADTENRLDAVAEIAFVARANSAATLSANGHKGNPKTKTEAEQEAKDEDEDETLLNGPSIKTLLPARQLDKIKQLQAAEQQLMLEQHLWREHRLNVVHLDGVFGQRLHVHVQLRPQQTQQLCLRLSEPTTSATETFFLALLPLHADQVDKYAVFLWYLDSTPRQFHTVIESQSSRVKWFGQAQPLSRSWPDICAAGQFLTWTDVERDSSTGFDIIVKSK